MPRQYFHLMSSALSFLLILTATAAFGAGGRGGAPAAQGVSITVRHDAGGLTATLHGAKGGLDFRMFFEYPKDGCTYPNSPKSFPCYVFSGMDLTQGQAMSSIPASGCPFADAEKRAECPASGVKSITLALESGGEVGVHGRLLLEGGGEGSAAATDDECSPAPVTVEAHAPADGQAEVDVQSGCQETVVCQGQGMIVVSADNGDSAKGNCFEVQRPNGTNVGGEKLPMPH
jgi:hypothetical protein